MTSEFTFVRGMTGVVVFLYVAAAATALAVKMITWQEFNAAVGPLAGTLLGYWIRGEK
jgi:hypothetical protein